MGPAMLVLNQLISVMFAQAHPNYVSVGRAMKAYGSHFVC